MKNCIRINLSVLLLYLFLPTSAYSETSAIPGKSEVYTESEKKSSENADPQKSDDASSNSAVPKKESVNTLKEFINAKEKGDFFYQKKFSDDTAILADKERAYNVKGLDFPFELKCTKYDYRTIHGCFKLSFFDPSARVYFDSNDSDGALDIFNDGNLNASINFVSAYVPWRFGRSEYFDAFSWGPALGVGVGAPARDGEDESEKSDGAPVVLFSAGFQFEYSLTDKGASVSFEVGRAVGFSSDESFKKSDDHATYVGLKIKIPTKSFN